MRTLEELTDVEDPAWPVIQYLVATSAVPVQVLPVRPEEGRRTLVQLQVTVRSALGALALHSGGLILDDGWLRVFGGGQAPGDAEVLPGLAAVNAIPESFSGSSHAGWQAGGGLILAHDALGGVFALNGREPRAVGRPGAPGQMAYFAPDTLEWEALEMGHSAWVEWLMSGRMAEFYDGVRWPGWRDDATALTCSQGISVQPPLWTKEAHADLAGTSRRAVPMAEVLGVAASVVRRMGWAEPGFLGQV
jgi:hypothetical protein